MDYLIRQVMRSAADAVAERNDMFEWSDPERYYCLGKAGLFEFTEKKHESASDMKAYLKLGRNVVEFADALDIHGTIEHRVWYIEDDINGVPTIKGGSVIGGWNV